MASFAVVFVGYIIVCTALLAVCMHPVNGFIIVQNGKIGLFLVVIPNISSGQPGAIGSFYEQARFEYAAA
jgi:hypothetical protein